jgi:hypothetical protein
VTTTPAAASAESPALAGVLVLDVGHVGNTLHVSASDGASLSLTPRVPQPATRAGRVRKRIIEVVEG